MASPLERGPRAETGHATTTLLVASPVVGLVVSIGLDWLISDPAPRPDGDWPVPAVLVAVLVLVLAVVVAAARLRQGGWAGSSYDDLRRPLRASLLGGLAAVGVVLALTLNDGAEGGATGPSGIVFAIIGLIAALVALIGLFTVLRRRSQ